MAAKNNNKNQLALLILLFNSQHLSSNQTITLSTPFSPKQPFASNGKKKLRLFLFAPIQITMFFLTENSLSLSLYANSNGNKYETTTHTTTISGQVTCNDLETT